MTVRSKSERAAERFAWIERVALDPTSTALSIRVAVVLSAMTNESGYAFPSYDCLAALTGASRKSVIAAIERLADYGLIKVEKDPRPGRSKVNRYFPWFGDDRQPVWSAYERWKESRQGDPLCALGATSKGSPSRRKESPSRAIKSHPEVTRPLEGTPHTEPSSDPNGSGALGAVIIPLSVAGTR